MRKLKQLWELYGQAESVWGLITSDWARLWLGPFVAWALTMLLAFIHAVPLPYLFAAACFAFACVATALLRIDEWWARTNVSGKLDLYQPLIAPYIDGQQNPPLLKSIQLGFEMKNLANFPVTYQVESVHTQFSGRVAVKKDYDLRGQYQVSSNGNLWFRDTAIPLEIEIGHETMEGEIAFRVAYWKKESKKFYFERKLKVFAVHSLVNKSMNFSWILS